MSQVFQQTPLTDIKPNSFNPRKRFSGRKFDELVASVASQGVIEPILIRPVKGKPPFEIVAGERRYRAASKAAEQNGGSATIPSLIRELSDDQAFEFMTIENLQREDLSELEEAESFKTYLDKKGDAALGELAERTGIHPGYIRRRIAVLSLPKRLLKAWDKGELRYGHLEQFIRISGNKKLLAEMITKTFNWELSVERLRHEIESETPHLSCALFNLKKAGCPGCAHNTETQKQLFDLPDKTKAKCLKPKCFKQNQNNHLSKHWKKTAAFKANGTTRHAFSEDLNYNDWDGFYFGGPYKDCKKGCNDFVTLFWLNGQVRNEAVCLNSECYRAKQKANSKRDKKTASNKGDGPRVGWHGSHFRQQFFQTRLPEKYAEVLAGEPAANIYSLRLTLFSLLKSNDDLRRWYIKRMGMIDEAEDDSYIYLYGYSDRQLFEPIAEMTPDQVNELLREATLEIIMQDEFGEAGRRQVAEHIGIDLAREWYVTEEYLKKKTVAEILAWTEKHGIFEEKAAKDYMFETLLLKRHKKPKKKSDIVKVILESGIDLKGKVPDEILVEDEN